MITLKNKFPIIDAHHHFWDLSLEKHPWLNSRTVNEFRYGDYSSIKKDYLINDYRDDTKKYRVSKTIHVEAEWVCSDPVGETLWLTKYHDKTGFPNGIVGQVWFSRGDAEKVLLGHSQSPLIRSVRQKPFATKSSKNFIPNLPGSLADPAFREGFKILSKYKLNFDLQTPWWHLGEAADLARDFSDTLIILNHTGLPSDRTPSGISSWREMMETFAAQPNTLVKISGICVPGMEWTTDLNRDIVLEVIRIFGVDRCMFASNFPVDKLLASFDQIFDGFNQITMELSERDRSKLFHDNALIYYDPV